MVDGGYRREQCSLFLPLMLILQEIISQEGSITHGQWTPDTTVEVEKKYVLAVGGRPLNSFLGYGGTLNHYSLMQWEGLFPCLPEIDDDGDLQESLRTAFQVRI